MNTNELLNKAADLIESRGLAKYTFLGKDGSLCINGALLMALTGEEPKNDFSAIYDYHKAELVEARKKLKIDRVRWDENLMGAVCMFNNKKSTTKKVAVAKLREAALS